MEEEKDPVLLSMPTKSKNSPRIGLKAVEKISVCEDVARQIMKLIAKGQLKPGQRLPPERNLCMDFGVGRSSLREALRCLSIIGVLDARVGEGTSVAKNGGRFLGKLFEWRLVTEQHDLEHLMDVRLALEGATAADTAKNATDEQIKDLKDLLNRMELAFNDTAKFEALDTELHVKIAEASANSLLFDLVSMIRSQILRGMHQVLILPRALPLSHKEHTAIVAAIGKRNPTAAKKAMEAHLLGALDRYRTSRK